MRKLLRGGAVAGKSVKKSVLIPAAVISVLQEKTFVNKPLRISEIAVVSMIFHS
jgi:hypothetical protein